LAKFFKFWAILFEFALEIWKSPNFSKCFWPSVENLSKKETLGNDSFLWNFVYEKNLKIEIFWKIFHLKKHLKKLVIFLQLLKIWKVFKIFLIPYFKYHQIWLNGLINENWTTS
jgi:hypothetical protein